MTTRQKSPRHRAREFAVQGLYQWQLAGAAPAQIERELSEAREFDRADAAYFRTLLAGATAEAAQLEHALGPHLDRAYAQLTPIERAILLIGAFELTRQHDVPFRVVINEAIDLAKSFGGTDAHKYVNGVLDKLAAQVRTTEPRRGETRASE